EDTEIENIIHEGESETSEDIDEEATSTLASIMQDNDRIEKSLLESDTKTDVDTQQSDETDEFQTLVQDNITRSKWLFNEKENISVAQDVQRQACQILSKLPRHLKAEKTTQIVNNLLSVLNSNDNKLRCYAADSIAQIALDNPQTAGIEYAFGGLITQYHNENWDLKLACMRALAAIRNRGAIPILASALDHQRSAIRIQAIQSITDLLIEGDAILKNAHVAEKPPTLIEWVNTLIDQLQDKEAGVRYSAVNNLKRCLLSDEINHQEGLIKKAIEHIVQAAFNNHGGRTRDMALVLKAIEPVQGTERLIQLLNELPNSYERRFAIEMLEEMYRTDSTDAVAA
ncbi:MAG: HEAT repeat domain-containing protein, partial [Bacteroidetes bacterium]|nr:HEAT repeat domain-containing protein [Bacteroidota bacterium]